MSTVYEVRDCETDEIVHEITHDGHNTDRFESGLYRKVDFERFYVTEREGNQ